MDSRLSMRRIKSSSSWDTLGKREILATCAQGFSAFSHTRRHRGQRQCTDDTRPPRECVGGVFLFKAPAVPDGRGGVRQNGGATPSFFFWAWCCTFVVCCGSPANNAKKQKNDHGGPAADHAPPLDPPPPKGKTGFREKLILDRVRYPTSRSSSHTITRDRCEGKTHKDRRRGREAGDG